jgi:protein involved in polysaccharide export with SLBB domain
VRNKGKLHRPLILIGLLVSIVHITLAQQSSDARPAAVPLEEGCRSPAVIFGRVASPGRFELRRRVRLRELIALAGGVDKRAKGEVLILHTRPSTDCESLATGNEPAIDIDNPKTFNETYRLSDVLRGDERANPYIRPGDLVEVGRIEHISVIGSVKNPGQIEFRKTLTAARAIAMAGGLSPDGRKDKIYVRRKAEFGRSSAEIIINLEMVARHRAKDLVLRPNDIIEVLGQKGNQRPLKSRIICIFP